MAKSKRPLPDIARNVLQDEARIREQAAWELLYAIEELFSKRLESLREIGERLSNESRDDVPEDHADNREAVERFDRAVEQWTEANCIRCDSVCAAAGQYAVNGAPTVGLYLDAHFDERGHLIIDDRGITAHPFNETRDQFLKKAGEYYDRLAQRFVREGAKSGVVKREGSEDFKCLAIHLVGGHSFAQIADSAERFGVAARSPNTIAEEVRKVADLIGLPMRKVPGPRPGSRIRRAALRTRR